MLMLWHDRERASADVKAVALSHIAVLKAKIAQLQTMAQTLERLATHGNTRPDCPILAGLAQPVALIAPRQTPYFE
ncbi:MerR family DNA-binding protein [Serratia ureilytica]